MRGRPVLLAIALAACGHRGPPASPPAAPHYIVGAAYQLGGTWSYPQERFDYEATGLAERLPDRTGLTADGERADPTAMVGAHRTLQLPAIVDVTNLANGRQLRIRLDDRGPATPGRILGLSRRAADLLDLPVQGAAPVRIQLDGPASQALRDRLGGGPRGITAAPVASVSQEALPAPGQPRATLVFNPARADPVPETVGGPLERLPESVRTVPVGSVQLWVRLADFTQPRYARALRDRFPTLPVQVRGNGSAGPGVAVMAGPFASVAAADEALDQVRAGGLTDASIVVE